MDEARTFLAIRDLAFQNLQIVFRHSASRKKPRFYFSPSLKV
jgi:hypothetical protein